LVTGRETFSTRSGWIVRSYLREKRICSEIAPLPGFSTETPQQIFEWISKHDSEIKKHIFDAEWISEIPFASVRFGLDCHRLQLLSATDGTPFQRFINPNAASKVPVNGLISLLDPIKAEATIKDFIAKGITVIKCKVGIKPAQEMNLIRIFGEKYPEIRWRLDANQAFDAEHAIGFINDLKSETIEYCEQPVPASDFSGLKQVKEAVPIPIAADESANSIESILKLIELNAVDVFVLKPMLLGCISEIQAIVDLIRQNQKKVVFTTTLESVVGRFLVGCLAAAMQQEESCSHGLATGYLFSSDLAYQTETIQHGFYELNHTSN
jgi:o-succinylbenzoate synthase